MAKEISQAIRNVVTASAGVRAIGKLLVETQDEKQAGLGWVLIHLANIIEASIQA